MVSRRLVLASPGIKVVILKRGMIQRYFSTFTPSETMSGRTSDTDSGPGETWAGVQRDPFPCGLLPDFIAWKGGDSGEFQQSWISIHSSEGLESTTSLTSHLYIQTTQWRSETGC